MPHPTYVPSSYFECCGIELEKGALGKFPCPRLLCWSKSFAFSYSQFLKRF